MTKPIKEKDLYYMFDTWIDEANGDEILIESFTFTASEVLKKVAPMDYAREYIKWLKLQVDNQLLFECGGDYYSDDPRLEYNERTGGTEDHDGWAYSRGYINHINEGL